MSINAFKANKTASVYRPTRVSDSMGGEVVEPVFVTNFRCMFVSNGNSRYRQGNYKEFNQSGYMLIAEVNDRTKKMQAGDLVKVDGDFYTIQKPENYDDAIIETQCEIKR